MASRKSSIFRTAGSGILLIVIIFVFILRYGGSSDPQAPAAGPGEYLFCFWNVENLFDDRDDRRGSVDEKFDNWMAENAQDRQLKLDHLAEVLLTMNEGRGPDILAMVEVESIRAAELLRDELNKKLPENAVHYGGVQMKEVASGRHIAAAVISRLPADAVQTRLHGKGHRILETRITANQHSLVILAMHWTSQITDKTGDSRDRYANLAHEVFARSFRADPAVDFLVCGDFNTDPGNESVTENLHALADRRSVAGSKEPLLLNLMAGKDPKQYGTLYYNRPLIYDHICISPGLLDDQGWSCEPDSIRVMTAGLIRSAATRREPWRFGNRNDSGGRGYSDHFPVTVTLQAR